MSIATKRIQVQLAHVRAARLANELKVEELQEAVSRIQNDIQISLDKEAELEAQMKLSEAVQ